MTPCTPTCDMETVCIVCNRCALHCTCEPDDDPDTDDLGDDWAEPFDGETK